LSETNHFVIQGFTSLPSYTLIYLGNPSYPPCSLHLPTQRHSLSNLVVQSTMVQTVGIHLQQMRTPLWRKSPFNSREQSLHTFAGGGSQCRNHHLPKASAPRRIPPSCPPCSTRKAPAGFSQCFVPSPIITATIRTPKPIPICSQLDRLAALAAWSALNFFSVVAPPHDALLVLH